MDKHIGKVGTITTVGEYAEGLFIECDYEGLETGWWFPFTVLEVVDGDK